VYKTPLAEFFCAKRLTHKKWRYIINLELKIICLVISRTNDNRHFLGDDIYGKCIICKSKSAG
jgi:hypothetical protein